MCVAIMERLEVLVLTQSESESFQNFSRQKSLIKLD